MARDYFQDIVPPGSGGGHRSKKAPPPEPADQDDEQFEGSERSIRDIVPSRTRIRLSGERGPTPPAKKRAGSRGRGRWLLWLAAGIALLVIAVLVSFEFRSTTVEVTPRSQTVTFDSSSAHFTAFPVPTAASGTLSYQVIETDLEDSEPIDAHGTQHVETKATGSITISNTYSSASVRLVKNTRFATQGGLIFRALTDIVVPGKKGATPGSVNVTVQAEQAGDGYNIGASSFTLPGLKTSAAMYKGVTARSTAAFTGGFSGDQPAVDPGALASTVSAIHARLAAKANADLQARDDLTVFPQMIQITYQSLPTTTETGGTVRVHEKAHVKAVAFPTSAFGSAIASAVSADAGSASISFTPQKDFSVQPDPQSGALSWGLQPIDFSLSGPVLFVWNVDTKELSKALAGRDQGAFQAIITGFPGVQEAHARIEPFWKSTFPADSSKIVVHVQPPSLGR